MKKIRILFAFLVAISLCACSNDSPERSGEIDMDYINSLSRDGSVSTYELQDYQWYRKDDKNPQADWELMNPAEWDGGDIHMENTLCFQDGRLWSPMKEGTSATGPFPTTTVWYAYKKVSGVKTELYTKAKFYYDEKEKTMSIGSLKYDVLEFTSKSLKLKYEPVEEVGTWNWETEEWEYSTKANNRELYDFTITTPKRFDGENIMAFDSDVECYRYILEVARKQFGRYIDLDQVYAGLVFLEQPIVDLDEVEAWVNEQEQKQK